jgi:hypothetical protein
VNVSKNLRAVLRHDGYAKLASEVMRAQNEYVGDISNISDVAKSVSIKVAANRENERVVADGLYSLRRLQEL